MSSAGTIEPLHLYGSALARDAALERLCRTAPAGAVWADAHRTFGEFLDELDRDLPLGRGEPRRVLGGAARYVVLRAAWLAAGADAGPPTRTGVEALGQLIAAWKGAGLSPAAVARAAGLSQPSTLNPQPSTLKHSRLGARLEFIARAYARYEAGLGAQWTDREGRERAILARIRAAGRVSRLAPGRPLRVHGLLRLIPFRRELLEALLALGHPVEIVPAVPLPSPNDERAGQGGSLLASFGRLAENFAPTPGTDTHSRSLASGLSVLRLEAPTPYAEVYEIGRQVRRWLEEGVEPERIGVAFRDLGPYSQFIADVFQRMNIPYYERRGEPLAFQPIVRATLAAVEAVEQGMQREALFRFLEAGPTDLGKLAAVKEAPVPSALHRLALDARVDRFFGKEQDDPAEAWRMRLESYAEGRKEEVAVYAEQKRGVEVLCRIAKRLAALRAPRSRVEFARDWRALWEDAGYASGDHAGDVRSAEALTALEDALDEAASGPGAGDARVTLEEFSEILSAAVLGRSVRRAGSARAGSVRVLNLYDLQGLSFERLVVGGLNAGAFPAVPAPDPLLGAVDVTALREALARAQLGGGRIPRQSPVPSPQSLPSSGLQPPVSGLAWPRSPAEALEEERALWDLARRAAGSQLLLTRTRRGFNGQPVGPSVFWGELGDTPVRAASSVRPAPALKECLFAEEAELRLAWVLAGGGPREQEERELAAAVAQPPTDRLAACLSRAGVERRRLRFFEEVARKREAEEAAAPVSGGPHDGALAPVAPPAALERCRLILTRHEEALRPAQTAELSPSIVEMLTQCPFRFLAQRVYRVEERETPTEELAPPARGSLWHDVLRRFYGGLLAEARAAGLLVVRLEGRREAEYRRRLRSAAAEELDAAPRRHFTGSPGVWELQRARIETGLEAWLRYELREAQGADAFRPARVEFQFGTRAADAGPPITLDLRTPGGLLPLRLAGRMDRLDLRIEERPGTKPVVTGLRLLDYKTSSAQNLRPLVTREALEELLNAQLPVYLLAAINWLKQEAEQGSLELCEDELWKAVDAAYFALRELPAANREGKLVLVACKDKTWKWREFLAPAGGGVGLEDALRERLSALPAGLFLVAPRECGGTQCPARRVCRYRDLPVTEEVLGVQGGEA